MEKLFVKEIDNDTWSSVLFAILIILTFGLVWLFYDEVLQRKYMINRRRLINAINSGEVTLVKRLPADPKYFHDIEMYDLNHGEDVYDLWLWTRSDGVIKVNVGDHIGLFTATFFARRLNDRLVKAIKEQANG